MNFLPKKIAGTKLFNDTPNESGYVSKILDAVEANRFKISVVYAYQCYSGYKGTLPDVRMKFKSQAQRKAWEKAHGKYYNLSQEANDSSDEWELDVDWERQWKARAVNVHCYFGTNFLMVDTQI